MKKFLTRLRNAKVLTAVVSGVLIVLVNTGLIDAGLSAKVTEFVNGILVIGVAVGVFGNPDSHVVEEEV